MPSSYKTVLECLREFAESFPNKSAWNFLDDNGQLVDSFSYQELEKVTTSLAAYLINGCNLKAGDRVLLVFFPGLHFTVSILACFKCGVIAVPVFPPDPRRLQKDLHHFISIQSSSGATVALTHTQYNFAKKVTDIQSMFASKAVKWPDVRWILVDDVISRSKSKSKDSSSSTARNSLAEITSDTIAFLQYTSGSTSEPKGVMISHRNLAHNEYIIAKSLGADSSTICVSWLPQYHDMGLIGSYLGVICCGGTGYYMSPLSFLKDPLLWIKSVSNYHATHTQAPNFAYALVSRKYHEYIAENGPKSLRLDLTALRHAINAAEPIDPISIETFYATFSQYGLQQGTIVPTYGLAEHTVFVCSNGKQQLRISKRSLESGTAELIGVDSADAEEKKSAISGSSVVIVGCGYPGESEGVEMLIVSPDSGQVLEELQIGEIWVRSPSKALGYWNRPDLTATDFNAFPGANAQSPNNNGYLRTGDLGFFHEQELFVCGRLKDLIIIRGANHYPQDIERSVEKCSMGDLLRPGCCAAVAVNLNGTNDVEDLVVIVEMRSDDTKEKKKFESVVEVIRQSISSEHGLSASVICLIPPRTIRKTTSGKIARAWCKRDFLAGNLTVMHRWEKQNSGGDVEYLENFEPEDGNDLPPGKQDVSARATGIDEMKPEEGRRAMPRLQPEEARAMSLEEISNNLEVALLLVSSGSPSQIKSPIDRNAPLTSLGLDSMTIVQYKGVLEKRFHTNLPDEFLFTQLASIHGLSEAVKCGGLTSDQKKYLDTATPPPAGTPGTQGPTGIAPVVGGGGGRRREPLCPWFTCCY